MATANITTASSVKVWVQACTAFEQCEIESLLGDVNFVESEVEPPYDTEIASMYFIKNVPRDFSGDGVSSLWIFIDNKSKIRKRPPSKNTHISGVDELRGALRTILGYGDMSTSSTGIAKVGNDVSLFTSSFTLNISRKKWVPFENGLEVYTDLALTHISYADGKAIISSGANIGNDSYVMSRRHPRHQSHRGHNASTLVVIPNKDAIGIREFGLFSPYYGAFFRLRDGILYAVVRNTELTVTTEVEQIINAPFELAIETGEAYMIQLQCPTAGNAKFFAINSATRNSELIHEMSFVSPFFINNSSMPFGFRSENTNGTEVEIQARCADVSTEGGSKGERDFSSVTSGEVATSTVETPIIALRVQDTFNGQMNTRDIMLSKLYLTSDSSPIAALRVYGFRDPSAIDAIWSPAGEGMQEVSANGGIITFDIAKMRKIFDVDIAANFLNQIDNSDQEVNFVLTHGDYIFVTVQAKNNSISKATLAYSEEI